MPTQETRIELAGTPVFLRRARGPGAGTEPTPLLLHTLPTSSDDLVPLLERTGGVAPDLIGFGRTGKGGHLDFTLAGEADFLHALLDALGIGRVSLVAHGWGAGGGLAFAARHPERVARIALLDPLPLTPGFAWNRLGRLLRAPVLGELAIGSVSRRMFGRYLRQGAVTDEAFDEAAVSAPWEQFDQGTQRAVLRMLRDASPERLAAAGAELARVSAPTLVIWGERDPWFPASGADAFGRLLPDARVERVAGAGHWPWLGHPEVLERVAAFVQS